MWALERKYVDPAEIDFGPITPSQLNMAWGFVVLVLLLSLGAAVSAGVMSTKVALYFVPIAVLLGRMAAIDMCYLLLLNIYTLPLACLGLVYSPYFLGRPVSDVIFGIIVGAGVGFLIDITLSFMRGKGELGFGDVKMLAALGAWVGLSSLPFALMVAFIVNFLLSLVLPKNQAIPFGVGLVGGIWAFSVLEGPFMQLLFKVFG